MSEQVNITLEVKDPRNICFPRNQSSISIKDVVWCMFGTGNSDNATLSKGEVHSDGLATCQIQYAI